MLLLAAATAAPAGAATPQVASLSVKPARAVAGARFTVVGRRFPARARVRLYLGSKRLKTLRANRRGRFRVRLRVPAGTPKLYRLTARSRRVRVRVRFRLLTTPAKKAAPAKAAAPAPPPPPPHVPTLVAAGDIACAPPATQTTTACHQGATASLVASLAPDAVAALGDNQYEHGELANFNASFGPSWGQFEPKMHPVPGNHEYTDPDATRPANGYYTYFGAAAGDPTEGYYSYSVGAWQVFVLNSGDLQDGVDCWPVSCAPGSAQATWLHTELESLPADKCVIAAIHHPHHASFANRAHPTEESALYDDLYDHGAELLLSGHDHEYEHFPPMSDATTVDQSFGIRQFIVGTGGRSHDGVKPAQVANSEILDNTHFGALELKLSPGSYTFRFVSDAGAVVDSGSGSCHGPHP